MTLSHCKENAVETHKQQFISNRCYYINDVYNFLVNGPFIHVITCMLLFKF